MPVILHKWCYRPRAKPSQGLPFGVRSVGRYSITAPFKSQDKKLDYLQFFWCVNGGGKIEVGGRYRVFRKNQVAVCYPGMRHYWYCDHGSLTFFFFTLDGSLAASSALLFGLQSDVYDVGPAPLALFNSLFRFVPGLTKQAELRACAAAFSMIIRSADARSARNDELVNAAVELMHGQYSSSKLNVKSLSDILGVRRTVLYSRFRAVLNATPSDYLARLRLQNALSLLTKTRLPIMDVAARSGYADTRYFSRLIRRATGYAPLAFRQRVQRRK